MSKKLTFWVDHFQRITCYKDAKDIFMNAYSTSKLEHLAVQIDLIGFTQLSCPFFYDNILTPCFSLYLIMLSVWFILRHFITRRSAFFSCVFKT